MKINIFILALIVLTSKFSFAAFNEKETHELNDINSLSELKLRSTTEKLKIAVDSAILDNPEKSEAILKLNEQWVKFIESKCKYENFESKGTDAEVYLMNNCLMKGYAEQVEYFSNLPP